MATQKQCEANKKNAQKCCGPKTAATKAISSQNALKTGIDAESEVIRCESLSEYQTLIAEHYARHHPTIPEERDLVDAVIRFAWMGRRYMAAEKSVYEIGFEATKGLSLGLVYQQSEKSFDRLDRRHNSAERNYERALKRLMEVQAQRVDDPDARAIPAPDALDPLVVTPDPLPNRDADPSAGEEAPLELPDPDAVTKQLNPELDSFLISTPETQPTLPEIQESEPVPGEFPPIAA